ncbi:hypothetical protein AMTR_s00107p00095610 [Amborella trichopoda]|uniref:RNase H type-1 domain-containing protein n=1 Tax=Amborella trichopoda TaxID=13333 RepID=W1NYD1_AMBTC|nr:hypothetical protein AMTR_s00107p00095610 [Amborella trichopoda]
MHFSLFNHIPKELFETGFHQLLWMQKHKVAKSDRWKPPPQSWVKLNVDGNVRLHGKIAGYGAVLRNQFFEILLKLRRGSMIVMHSNRACSSLADALAKEATMLSLLQSP